MSLLSEIFGMHIFNGFTRDTSKDWQPRDLSNRNNSHFLSTPHLLFWPISVSSPFWTQEFLFGISEQRSEKFLILWFISIRFESQEFFATSLSIFPLQSPFWVFCARKLFSQQGRGGNHQNYESNMLTCPDNKILRKECQECQTQYEKYRQAEGRSMPKKSLMPLIMIMIMAVMMMMVMVMMVRFRNLILVLIKTMMTRTAVRMKMMVILLTGEEEMSQLVPLLLLTHLEHFDWDSMPMPMMIMTMIIVYLQHKQCSEMR